MANATRKTIPGLIADRKPFTGSNIFGNAYPNGAACSTGMLTGVNQQEFSLNRANIRYVVFSYYTPIAWVYADGSTYRVTEKFSVTTSKHQGLLRGI